MKPSLTPLDAAGSLRAARLARPWALLWLLGLTAACSAAIESHPPLSDPAGLLARVDDPGADGPSREIRFDWKYGDLRGDVRGEGVARFSPPDSLRLDLFSSGELAMAVAWVSGELRSQGQIEDVEIPPLPLAFAMAGLIRPGVTAAPEAYAVGSDSVLAFADGEVRRYYFLREGRIRRVEDRRRGTTVRRVNLRWSPAGEWPKEAEYRDLQQTSRVWWSLGAVRVVEEPYPAEIYDLPALP